MTLAGRTAVVTGAGRGIGRATALALAGAGVARICLVARDAHALGEAAGEVRALGAEALVMPADLSRPEEAVLLVESLPTVDILVNNAATVAPLGTPAALAPDEVDVAFRLNVVAPVLLAGSLSRGMVGRGWGRIVAVSSGIVADPSRAVGSAVYAATKSALEAHVLALAAELDGTGVTVNAYRPGIVDTSMQQWVREQDPEEIGGALHGRFVESYRSGSLITPERSAASLVAHLGSAAPGASGPWGPEDYQTWRQASGW